MPLTFLFFLIANCASGFRGKRAHFALKAMLMSLQSDRVRGERAALLGQLSLACHLSVSSALLDIYLPCRAAGPVTCHSLPSEARSAKASYFPHPHYNFSHKTLHTQKCVPLDKPCIVLFRYNTT